MFIRTASIQALGNMVVRRPDMFLKDKYLKYFGWMLSDKDECVRFAALEGLNRPYEEVQQAEKNGRETSIELSNLEHVTMKFLSRIVDTVIDVHTSVQESGMKLMLSLLRAGFLDEIDDEKMWNQVNTLAFETTSTPTIRRNALYFIMEQLEEFDEGDAEEGSKKKRKSKKLRKLSYNTKEWKQLDLTRSEGIEHTLQNRLRRQNSLKSRKLLGRSCYVSKRRLLE
jgi:cohesin complex subunit SA-1/2